jgi:hypothetical protein
LVFVLAFLLFGGIILCHNLRLFSDTIVEEGDMAGNSILVNKAKHFRLLVGNPSSKPFYHPGPGLLYMMAGAEWVLYDVFHVVPRPHNAQILGVELMYVCMIALALAMFHSHCRSLLGTGAAAAAFLAYFAIKGHLTTHWFQFMYFPLFLCFGVASASTAAGRSWHAVWLALSGCLLVHGHVCFVAFVVPMSVYGFAGLWLGCGQKTGAFLTANWRQAVVFTLIVAIFLLPIVIHTIRDYPGEIGKYWQYSAQRHRKHNSFRDTWQYVVTVFNSSVDLDHRTAHPYLLGCLIIGGLVVSWPSRFSKERWRFTAHLAAMCVLATVLLYYYGSCGVDDVKHLTYTGVFFGSVMLVLISVAATNCTMRFGKGRLAACLIAFCLLCISGVSSVYGRFTNPYHTFYRAAGAIDGVHNAIAGSNDPVVLTVHRNWGTLSALIIDLERRHVPVFVADTFNNFRYMWTEDYSSGWEGLAHPRYIDLANPEERCDPGARVLFEDEYVSVREYDGHYPVGSVIHFAGCREAKVYKCYGWWDVHEDRTWAYGPESKLVLNPDRPIVHDCVLSVTAIPFVTERNPELHVEVIVNGAHVSQWVYHIGDDFVERETVVPQAVLAKQSPLQIVFRFPNAKSPAEVLPPSTDNLKLALGVRSIQLSEKAP